MDDEELSRRLSGAADEVARSPLARPVPGMVGRAVRRHRVGVAAQAATATLALVAVAVAVPRLTGTDEQAVRVPIAPVDSGSPTVTEAPSASPTPARSSASPAASPSPTATAGSPDPQPVRQPGPSPTEAPEPPEPPRVTRCAPPTGERQPPSGVTVRLETADRASVGGSLRLTLRVRNDGLTPVQYTTSGRQYDFWAVDEAGTVWRWSVGRAFVDPLISEQLDPGEEKTASVDWDLSDCAGAALPPGGYAVRGLWVSEAESDGSWWSDPVPVTIAG